MGLSIFDEFNTSKLQCFNNVLELLSLRLSRRIQLLVLRYCNKHDISVANLVLELHQLELADPNPWTWTEQKALDCFQYFRLIHPYTDGDQSDEEVGPEEQEKIIDIMAMDTKTKTDALPLVGELIMKQRKFEQFLMGLEPTNLTRCSERWINSLAIAVEAGILLEATPNTWDPDTFVPMSPANFRSMMKGYFASEMHSVQSGPYAFHTLFYNSVRLDGPPRVPEAGPLFDHRGRRVADETEVEVYPLEPRFKRSQLERLVKNGGAELRGRLEMLHDLDAVTASANYDMERFRGIYNIGKLFVESKLLDVRRRHDWARESCSKI